MTEMPKIPAFGTLTGVKVVNAALSVAGPFACQLMAEWGADVLWLENVKTLDVLRNGTGYFAEAERKNELSMPLNIPSPEGKEILFRVIKDADIFIEASKGGQYAKWGLTDDVLWSVNPKLVIVHISGFGQTGLPEYVKRGSYDPIAQAFGCYMQYNGFADRDPVPANPQACDYFTGFMACCSALAAYIKAKETGVGDSIDVAQYETLIRVLNSYPVEFMNLGIRYGRAGNRNAKCAAFGLYKCKDEKCVYISMIGPGISKVGCAFLGVEYGTEDIPAGLSYYNPKSVGGQKIEAALMAYLQTKTAAEAEQEMVAAGIPAQMVMDIDDAIVHPHYIARETFTEWDAVDGRKIKGVNVMPKFSNHPGQIWRGCPTKGMDTKAVLENLGYTEGEIASLYESGIVG
ncbi:MAG: L-carnitine CoA-transferase [Oscillospiraceae bacterium]